MRNSSNYLKIPAIKGVIGDWIYYQTVLTFSKVAEIVDNNHSIREYSSLDDVLQRDLSRRSKKIRDYLIREESRFFNSVILGLYGENPNWYRFDFSPAAIPEMALPEDILNTIGILEFSGGESLFSIDGQHRIDGIKQAIGVEPEKFVNDELPVILIAHNDTREGKKRTRRLFSEINTKALKVSGLDDLITNEDNPVDINARRLFASYAPFENNTFIALNKTINIDPESEQFTTILNLKEVNKVLYSSSYRHRDFRPEESVINSLYEMSQKFWDEAIAGLSCYNSTFIEQSKSVSDFRNNQGGSMLFRPVGIVILARAYTNWIEEYGNSNDFWTRFEDIDDDLNGIYWKDILWDNARRTIRKVSLKFTREYTKYLLAMPFDSQYVIREFNKLKGIELESEYIELPVRPNLE